jgi:hypothetical protein
LQSWVDSWLNKAGVNEIQIEVKEEEGANAFSVGLHQRFPVFGDE